MMSPKIEEPPKVFKPVTICVQHHNHQQKQQVNIRLMRADDAQASAEIIREAYLDECRKIEHATKEDRLRMCNPEPSLALGEINGYLDETDSVLFVAENTTETKANCARLVSFCRLKLCQNGNTINGGPFAQIGPFATLCDFQGYGIGTAILHEAQEYAQCHWGVAEIQLEVHGVKKPTEESEAAPMIAQMHFYAKRGFRRTGKVRWFNPLDAKFVVVPNHLTYLELMVKNMH